MKTVMKTTMTALMASIALLAACTPEPADRPDAGPPGAVGDDPPACRGVKAWKSVSLTFPATKVVTADFDGDGLDDIAWFSADGAVGNPDFGLWFVLSNGDGTFTDRTLVDPGNFRSIRAIDVNQDGRPDLVLTAKTGTAGIGGVFVYAWQPATGDFSDNVFAGPATIFGFNLQDDIDVSLVADLDGDGNVELLASDIVQNGGAPPVILPGTGPGTFGDAIPPSNVVTSSGIITGFAATDLTGDGRLDLIMGHQDETSSGASVAVQNSDLSFQASVFSDMGGAGFPLVLDVDGDGVVDLIWGSVLYHGLGGTDFAAPQTVSQGFNVIARDLDLDGNLDLLAGSPELNAVAVAELGITWGTGTATFASAPDAITIPASVTVAAGNVDGARGLDLVVDGAAADGLTVLFSRCIAE